MNEEATLLRAALARAEASLLAEHSARLAAEQAHHDTQQQMKSAVAELEQFAYITSHDLQAPLRNITGFSQLLVKRYKAALPEDAQEFLGYIQGSVQHMQLLIDDLLAFSRVGRTPEPQLHPLPLSNALERAMASLATTAQVAGARVDWDNLPTLHADHRMLVQLFTNLFDNAIKFQPAGQAAQVRVSAEQEAGHWLVTVADNGIGLPPDHLEDIFAVFCRLHTQEQYPGTGIGLAICRKVAAYHGGRIWAESEGLGKGVRIKLRLPIVPR